MARRKRKHIPMIEIAASALADKLEPNERYDLKAARVSARTVLRLFTPDHIKLVAFGGENKWWNIDMARRGPVLKLKDRADTSRAAKARRIDEAWRSFMRAVAAGKKPPRRKRTWPKRKMRRGA